MKLHEVKKGQVFKISTDSPNSWLIMDIVEDNLRQFSIYEGQLKGSFRKVFLPDRAKEWYDDVDLLK